MMNNDEYMMNLMTHDERGSQYMARKATETLEKLLRSVAPSSPALQLPIQPETDAAQQPPSRHDHDPH